MSNCVANCYDMTLERFLVISIFFHLSWLFFRGLRVHSMSHLTYWFGQIYEMLIKSSQSGMLLPMWTRSNRKLFVPVEWSILLLVLLVLSLPAIRKHWCKPADLRPCTWTIYAMYGNILCGPCSEGLNDIMKRWRQQVNFYLRNPSAMTLHLHNSLLYLHQICFFQNYLSPLDPSFDFFFKGSTILHHHFYMHVSSHW
jgi:hypothetical protein